MNLIETKKAELEKLQKELASLEAHETEMESVSEALAEAYVIQTKGKLNGNDAKKLIAAMQIVMKRMVTLEAKNVMPEVVQATEKTEQREHGGIYSRRHEFIAWILVNRFNKTIEQTVSIFKAQREKDIKDGKKPVVSSALYTASKYESLFKSISQSGQLDKWMKDEQDVTARLKTLGII